MTVQSRSESETDDPGFRWIGLLRGQRDLSHGAPAERAQGRTISQMKTYLQALAVSARLLQ